MSRLCLFTDSLEPSGVGAHMLTLAAHLRARHDILFACPPSATGGALLARARALGVATLALADDGQPAHAILRERLREERVEIFHGHAGIGWECNEGIEVARAAGVGVVLRTEHLPYLITHPAQRARHRRTVALVDRVICVSDGVRRSLHDAGIPADRLRVVRNGIDPRPSQADRDDVRVRLGLPPGARVALTVGRFTEQKGYHDLAEAVPEVVSHAPQAHFLWVGDGPCRDESRRQVCRLGVAGHVHFLGQRPDVPDLLAAADLFVLPSLFEGLPLALLEAMAAGLPVIGTFVCGTADAIRDGVTGRLVPPGNPVALAAALLDALERPERARAWGIAAHHVVRRDFSAARMARETDVIYRECLAGPARSRRTNAGCEPATVETED